MMRNAGQHLFGAAGIDGEAIGATIRTLSQQGPPHGPSHAKLYGAGPFLVSASSACQQRL